MQPTIPQPSLAGHGFPGRINCRTINAALANRDRRRTEEEWVWCAWDNTYRPLKQIRVLVVV